MKKLHKDHIIDRTGSFSDIYDMFAESFKDDDPEEAAKCRRVAQELRDMEDRDTS